MLTERDLDKPGFEGAKFLCSPAPRSAADQEALWGYLRDGTLSVFSSDHAPNRFDDVHGKKVVGEEAPFAVIPNGVPGLETRLPILFSEGVVKGRIDLQTFVALSATNPARLFGLHPRKGTIAIGADADIAIWDPERKVRIRNADLHHQVDYTVYEDVEVTGWPVRIERPKSPRTTPPSQCRYCIQMGSFSPILRRSAASASGVAFSPSIMTAASAGRI